MGNSKNVDIAILGYGTVGSGVAEVITMNQETVDKNAMANINIKYILDLREFEADPLKDRFTKDFNDILNDDDVKIVVEVMGGLNPSYDFVKQLLKKKKHVATSNKELVARHGVELLAIAKENSVSFLFEASVGGGIPIIRPFCQCLNANDIEEISGILNGTTNYILSKMMDEGLSFEDVLKDAQEKGYAEKNPDADVLGHDACRKIAILASLATGRQVDFEEVDTVGITHVTSRDIEYVKQMNCSIKLIASAKIQNKTDIYARVSPTIIKNTNPLYMVKDVFNAVLVKGDAVGELMFYGQGAGKLATASAVVADIIQATRHIDSNIIQIWSDEKLHLKNIMDMAVIKLIRVESSDKDVLIGKIKEVFGDVEMVFLPNVENEFGFITNSITEKELEDKSSELSSKGVNILNCITFEK